jgi:hypothetical protein
MLEIRIKLFVHCFDNFFTLVHWFIPYPNLMDYLRNSLRFFFPVHVSLKFSSRIENSKIFHGLPILQQMIHTLNHSKGIIFKSGYLELSSVDWFQPFSIYQWLIVSKLDVKRNIEDMSRWFYEPFCFLSMGNLSLIRFISISNHHS